MIQAGKRIVSTCFNTKIRTVLQRHLLLQLEQLELEGSDRSGDVQDFDLLSIRPRIFFFALGMAQKMISDNDIYIYDNFG